MKSILLFTFLGFYFLSWAQPENAQIEVIEGKRYYIHFVQGGNTLYGIHKLYNIPVEELIQVNPETKNGVQEGQRILIPIKGVESLPENLVIHKVEPKETVYGISKKYDVSIEKLTELNPGIESGLNEGQEIKVPVKMPVGQGEPLKEKQQEFKVSFRDSVIKHTVLKSETLYSISKRFMVPESEIRKINSLKNDKIKPGDLLNIPIKKERIEKVEIRKIEPAKSTQTNPGKQTDEIIKSVRRDSTFIFKKKESYNIAMLMPLFLDKPEGYNATIPDLAAGFYMGAKAAFDSLQKMGLNAKVYIHDSQNDSTSVANILQKPEFQNIDLIIGPFYGDNSEYVANWCKERGVRMICPFATNYEILRNNQFVYEAVTSDVTLSEGLAKHLAKTTQSKSIMLIRPKGDKDLVCYEAFRAMYLKESEKYKSTKLIETTPEDFTTFIKPDVSTSFVYLSSDKTESMEFVNALNKAAFKANSNPLTIYGTKDWANFSNISSTYKNKYNLQFATCFDLNYNEERTKNFHKKFRVQYSADLSRMALQGYDVTTHFCQMLLMQKSPKMGLMNDFKMVQKGKGNGYENNKCTIVKQVDYDFIKVAEINE